MREIYLDNAATTKIDKIVADEVYKVMTDYFGNPSSRHSKGSEAANIISNARKSVSKLIHCEPENIIFTSGGTESNNLAILGSFNLKSNKNKNVVTSSVEHSSVSDNMKKLESSGIEVRYIKPGEDGEIDPREVWNLIDENTALVSIMHINNETGNIYDIEKIVKGIRYKNKDTIIHCDGVQAFGKIKININVTSLDIDLYTFSGHKIHAPKGVGGIYIKSGLNLRPMILGGSQEYGYRAGTENVAGIASLSKACELIDVDNNLKYINNLSQLLVKEISNIKKIHINSVGNISPYVFNFSIVGRKSEVILNELQKKSIFISNGSACSKGQKSKALKGMNIKDEYIDSAIRAGLSKYNTKEDISDFILAIKEIIKEIR